MSYEDESPASPFRMRWWGWLVSLGLIVGVIVSIAFPVNLPLPPASVPFTTTSAPPAGIDPSVVEITADTLINAYNNSVPKAVTMYEGQTLCVSGLLSRVGENSGRLYAELKSSTQFMTSDDTIICYFQNEDAYKVAASAVGREIKITGVCGAYPPITFVNCALVHVPEI